ncbi:hypothetical protein ATN83_3117 [Raoultella ornithinolytica]|nr:hypothetical protein ATN83_3117 [Raoultella ornithinolytica]KDV93719.1 hypothetical protein AB00_1863 [Raoultella ornithinolytica 2-156-04_S1_C1]KDX13951.1 hypothetical protein AB28_2054 [Raoultella ornithinolytica 2-156-04_S1_C2]
MNAGEKTFQSAHLIHRYNFPLWLWLHVYASRCRLLRCPLRERFCGRPMQSE